MAYGVWLHSTDVSMLTFEQYHHFGKILAVVVPNGAQVFTDVLLGDSTYGQLRRVQRRLVDVDFGARVHSARASVPNYLRLRLTFELAGQLRLLAERALHRDRQAREARQHLVESECRNARAPNTTQAEQNVRHCCRSSEKISLE